MNIVFQVLHLLILTHTYILSSTPENEPTAVFNNLIMTHIIIRWYLQSLMFREHDIKFPNVHLMLKMYNNAVVIRTQLIYRWFKVAEQFICKGYCVKHRRKRYKNRWTSKSSNKSRILVLRESADDFVFHCMKAETICFSKDSTHVCIYVHCVYYVLG